MRKFVLCIFIYSICILAESDINNSFQRFRPYKESIDSINYKSPLDSLNRILKIPITLKKPYFRNKRESLKNVSTFIYGENIVIDSSRVLLQNKKVIDPRDVIYELGFYKKYKERTQIIEDIQKKRRAFVLTGIYTSWVFGLDCIPLFVLGGIKNESGFNEWKILLNEYNGDILKKELPKEKLTKVNREFKRYERNQRFDTRSTIKLAYSRVYGVPLRKNAKVILPFPGPDSINLTSIINLENEPLKTQAISFEYGNYFKNNYIGIRGFIPVPIYYNYQKKDYSYFDSLSIKYVDITGLYNGGYFLYKRRLNKKSNVLNSHLLLNLGLTSSTFRIVNIEKKNMNTNDYIKDPYHAYDLNIRGFSPGGIGVNFNIGNDKLRINTEYICNLGWVTIQEDRIFTLNHQLIISVGSGF